MRHCKKGKYRSTLYKTCALTYWITTTYTYTIATLIRNFQWSSPTCTPQIIIILVGTKLKKFSTWSSFFRIPTLVRPIIYCHAIKKDSSEDWNFLWSHYDKAHPSIDNDIVLESLGCSPRTETLEKYTPHNIITIHLYSS